MTDPELIVTVPPLVLVALTRESERVAPSGSEALVSRSGIAIVKEEVAARVKNAGPAIGEGLPITPFQNPPSIVQEFFESLPASGWPIVPLKDHASPPLVPPPASTVVQSMRTGISLGER